MKLTEKQLLKFIGEEMTINAPDPKHLDYRIRYGAIEIMLRESLVPPAYFKKNSPRLASKGWTVPELEKFLATSGARKLGPVKREKPIPPFYD